MQDINVLFSILTLTFLIAPALFYLVFVRSRGRQRFERIDRDGSGVLVGTEMKEMAFWFIRPLTKILVKLGASPDGISYTTWVLGLAAGIALGLGHFGIGAFLVMVSSLCDALDGWVARESGRVSARGAMLDSSIDRYVEFFIMGGLIVFYRSHDWAVVLSLAALLGAFMVSYSTAKADEVKVEPPRGSMRRSDRAVYLFLGCLLTPLAQYFFPQDLIGWPMIFCLGLIAIFANQSAIVRIFYVANHSKRVPNE